MKLTYAFSAFSRTRTGPINEIMPKPPNSSLSGIVYPAMVVLILGLL